MLNKGKFWFLFLALLMLQATETHVQFALRYNIILFLSFDYIYQTKFMKKDNPKPNLGIKVVLAVIGFVVIIFTGQLSKLDSINQIDIFVIQLPLVILGFLLMLPIIFYVIKRR